MTDTLPFPPSACVTSTITIKFVHARGVVHRDVKPDNLLISALGKTVLADFGLAKVLAQGQEMGRFLLGSTVVVLFPEGGTTFNPAWQPAGGVRLGEPMAERNAPG